MKIYTLVLLALMTSAHLNGQYNTMFFQDNEQETLYEVTADCSANDRFLAGIIDNVGGDINQDKLVFGKSTTAGVVINSLNTYPNKDCMIHPNVEMISLKDSTNNCVGYLIAISISFDNGSTYNLNLIRTDTNGNIMCIVDPMPINSMSEYCNELIQESDGHVIMVGTMSNSSLSDLLVARFDLNCALLDVGRHHFTALNTNRPAVVQGMDIIETFNTNTLSKYAVVGRYDQQSMIVALDQNLDYVDAKYWSCDNDSQTYDEAKHIVQNGGEYAIVGQNRINTGIGSFPRQTYFIRLGASSGFIPFLEFYSYKEYYLPNDGNYPNDMLLKKDQTGYIVGGATEVCEDNCVGTFGTPYLMEIDLVGDVLKATKQKGVYTNATPLGHGEIHDLEHDDNGYCFGGKLWDNSLNVDYNYFVAKSDLGLETSADCFEKLEYKVDDKKIEPLYVKSDRIAELYFPVSINTPSEKIDVEQKRCGGGGTGGLCDVYSTISTVNIDSCCFALNLNNTLSNICKIEINLITTGATFVAGQVSSPAGFPIVNSPTQIVINQCPTTLPNGSTSNYVNFCMNTLASAGAFSLDIQYFDTTGRAIDCRDTLSSNCDSGCNPVCTGNWNSHGFAFIFDLHQYNGDIIAGGQFVDLGGNPQADFVAKWDVCASQWVALGDGFNAPVLALEVYQGELYAGGGFTASGSTTLNGLAKWNGTNWVNVGDVTKGGVAGMVLDLQTYGNQLIVAGDFDQAGALSADDIASYSSAGTGAWSVLAGSSFTGTDFVSGLGLYNNDLIVGGCFPSGIRSFNGTSWSSLSGGVTNGGCNRYVDHGVLAIKQINNDLYIGGSFSGVLNGTTPVANTNNVAKWDGTTWASIGNVNPSNTIVYDIEEVDCGILFGGAIRQVNGNILVDEGLALYDPGSGIWSSANGSRAIIHAIEKVVDNCGGNCRLFVAGEGPFQEMLVDVNSVNKETISKKDVQIYPNPAEDIIYIETDIEQSSWVYIYDIEGHLLGKKKMKTSKTKIDLSKYNTGIYLISVLGQNGHQSVTKVVKY